MLNDRHDGDVEKSARETERAEQQRGGFKGRSAGKQEGKSRHSGGAHGDQPVLDLSTREVARDKTSNADADGGLQVSDPVGLDPEDVTSVILDRKPARPKAVRRPPAQVDIIRLM